MVIRLSLLVLFSGLPLTAADYLSPYQVEYTFSEEELIGDLLSGSRGDPKDQSSVPYRDWYKSPNQSKWGYWGPPAQHFDAPSGMKSKDPEWARQRVIATALRFKGYSYQHHHIPDWDPPADWPLPDKEGISPGKGVDCSNYSAFVYNLALGYKPTGNIKDQSLLTEVPGPGPRRTTEVTRIELPDRVEDFGSVLRTADLLFIRNRAGEVSHVVLWVGEIGRSPDGLPLILDSTGEGSVDSNGVSIPSGIYLRPFKPGFWYASSASHALRILP